VQAGCTYCALRAGDDADGARLATFAEGVPAGVPQAYVDVWVMRVGGGGELEPAPAGTPGEVCFGGGGEGFMAVGYWRNQPLTDEKFVHSGRGRLYRTGDAGEWRGGQLCVLGRLDRQVKVRGVRIQPEEVEARRTACHTIPCDPTASHAIASHGVHTRVRCQARLKRFAAADGSQPVAACLVVPSAREPVELSAFLEAAAGRAIDVGAVRSFLLQAREYASARPLCL
jgi:acyl-CoA synthetase (AMP-forming)/AMP-acid ligase II